MIRIFKALLCVISIQAIAQEQPDTTAVPPLQTSQPLISEPLDTVKIRSYEERFDPRKALLYSAVVPGLGQIYNKKYWKVPIVYGGFAAIAYGYDWNNGLYKLLKSELFYNLEHQTNTSPELGWTNDQLRPFIDRYRRQRDLMVVLFGAMYILQIIDAHVDAHLKAFDVNPNLQVKLQPMMDQNTMTGRQTGLSLIVQFKN